MAADTSAVPAENLRVVLSVPTPVDGDDEKEEAASVEKSIATIQQAWKSLLPKTKANKKKQVVVGVLTDAAAVCVAHGITDLASKQEKQYNNVLVVDWGASGLTLTQFRSCGNTGMLQQVTSQRESSIKASIFVETMAKFVASQFERKNRFPSGEVFENSKARTKLITSCETALKTMSNSKTSNAPVHVTIDGLYEGTDCHIPISKPRWDMLTSSFLKKAQAMLEAVMFDGDAVLVAGSVVSMPKAQQIINETFATCYRGLATIPPEEAVAMGCARQGAQVLALLEDHPEVDMKDISKSPSRPNVPLSPVSLGVGCCKEEPKMVATLVDNGTPLPAHSKHVFDVQAQEEYGVYQMTPSRKLVAKLEGLPETGQVEIMVELSAHGVVSLSVQGGPLVRIV